MISLLNIHIDLSTLKKEHVKFEYGICNLLLTLNISGINYSEMNRSK